MRFNEGGADCPPIDLSCLKTKGRLPCFNEGGADCPPIVRDNYQNLIRALGFNEGGADCPPIVCQWLSGSEQADASMKGGRTAPR